MQTLEIPSFEIIVAQLETPKATQDISPATRNAIISAERALNFIAFAHKYHIPAVDLAPTLFSRQTKGWVIVPPNPDALGLALLTDGHTYQCEQRGLRFIATEAHVVCPYASEEALHMLATAAFEGLSQEQALVAVAHPSIPAPRATPHS